MRTKPHSQFIGLAEKFMRATEWRGPCELEVMRDKNGEHHLIEVNPRFPAWTYLSAGAGQNLPWAVARKAAGEVVAPLGDYQAGVMFVRIAIDQLARMEDFEAIASHGALRRQPSQHATSTDGDAQ
jgi:carbamoyl-phosphate synthase large subunit